MSDQERIAYLIEFLAHRKGSKKGKEKAIIELVKLGG